MRRTHRHLFIGLMSLLPACSSADSLTCGEGTEKKGDTCVATGVGRASVKQVSLTSLSLTTDAGGPLYVAYPARAAATLEVEGEAFESMAIVGLSSADGKTGCYVGKFDISHKPPSGDGAAAVSLAGSVFVQPECAALVGQKDVRAWVAFDPFGAVDVDGRAAPKADTDAVKDFFGYFQQTRLPDDACGATCKASIEVKASPGLDVVLQEVALDSDVATIAVLDAPVPAPDPATLGPDYAGVTFAPAPPLESLIARLPSTPQFHVNAGVTLYGATTTGKEKAIDADQISVSFALRPSPLHAPAGLPEAAFAWVPLSIQEQTLTSAGMNGETVSTTRLEEQFLAGLAARQRYQKESPVYIDGDALSRVQSLEGTVKLYELRTCVTAKVAEKSPTDDATANNCVVREVAVVVDHRDPDGVSTTTAGAESAADLSWSKSFSYTTGSTDSMQLATGVSTSNGCNAVTCWSTSSAYLDINGDLVPGDHFTAFGLILDGYALLDNGTGFFRRSLVIANQQVWGGIDNLTDGVTVNVPTVTLFSQEFQLFEVAACVPDTNLCATLSGSVTPTVDLDASLRFKTTPAPSCASLNGVEASNKHCFAAETQPRSYNDARDACQKKGGYLAEIASADENQAAASALAKKNIEKGWLGASRKQIGCKTFTDPFFGFTTDVPFNCTQTNANAPWTWYTAGAFGSGTYTSWGPGLPVQSAYTTSAVISKTGAWGNLIDQSLMPYVCEYVTTHDFTATVTPSLSFPLTFAGRVGFSGIAEIGPTLVVDPVKLSFPLTANLNLYRESTTPKKYNATIDFTSQLELSGLEGSLSLDIDTFIHDWSYEIVSWDGIPYATYTLGNAHWGTTLSL